MTTITIHDLTQAQYDGIGVKEECGRTGVRWKTVETSTISIAFFRPEQPLEYARPTLTGSTPAAL